MEASPQKTRVALVTGASRGIGLEVARGLALRGYRVYAGMRTDTPELQALLRTHENISALPLVVTEEESLHRVIATLQQAHPALDVLVNNAAIYNAPGHAPAVSVPTPTLRDTFEVNFFAAVAVAQACYPLLARSPAARVVNMVSGLASLARHSQAAQSGQGPSTSLLTPVAV